MGWLLVLSYPTISALFLQTTLIHYCFLILFASSLICLCDVFVIYVLANILLQAYCVGRNMECKFAQQKKRGPSKRQRTMDTEEGMQPYSLSLSSIFFGCLTTPISCSELVI